MPWMFLLFGLASLTGQIVLLREILVIFHGTEISIGIFYGVWLVGIGVGASFGAWLVRTRSGEFHEIFLHSLAALGFSLLFQIVLLRNLPALFGVGPAELAPLRGILASVPFGTFLTAFLTGFLFPVGCRCARDADDRLIARLFAFEAFGSLAGGLILTFLLLRFLPPLRIASVIALVLAGGAVTYSILIGRRTGLFSALSLLICAGIILSPAGEPLIQWSVQARWEGLHPGLKLLVSRPTPYQEVEIGRLGKQLSLFGNGTIVSSFPDPHSTDRLAALIMAEKPDAKRFLLIGGAIGSFVGSLLKYPVERLDIVEPDPWAFRIAQESLPSAEAAALKDPRVKMIFQDGRFFMNRVGSSQYDMIVTMIPDPVSSFWNRYYTLEFFESARRALTESGVFFTKVTSAENFWGTEVASYAGSVYHTLKTVFAGVKGTPGDETLFFASRSPKALSVDSAVLKKRYISLGVPVFDPAGFDTILPPERTAFVEKELESSPAFINTDFRPISSSLAMILWGRFSGSERLEVLDTIRRGGLKVYLIPMLFFLVARIGFRARWGTRGDKEARFQAVLAMAAMGGAAMGLQIVLIYAYQSLFGYVFERVGLFAAIFMMGLVAGGFGAGRALARVRNKTLAIVTALLTAVLICLIVPLVLTSVVGREPWLIETVILTVVFVSGVVTGATFPLVASRHLELSRDAGESSGWTDAADHYGAALGAALTGTLLVPLLGINEACLILAVFLVTPAVLMALEFIFPRLERLLEARRPIRRTSFPFVGTSWVLCCAVAAAFTWSIVIGRPGATPTVTFSQETLEKISGSRNFSFLDKPFPHYRGNSGGTDFSVSLSTSSVAGDVRGYGGPINLLVSVSDAGIIRGVKIVESRETPSYLKGMDTWLAGLQGRSLMKPLKDEVDALAGATITCRAVTEILEKTGEKIAGPILGLPTPVPTAPEVSFTASLKDVRLWVVVGLILFFLIAFHSRSRTIRLSCLAASFVILGIYLNAPFTSLDAATLLRGEIPAAGTLWRNALLIGTLLISVFWGQAFCGFLCPFGALQEFLSVKALRKRASPRVEQAGRYLKFVLLAVLLCVFLTTDETDWFSFSPLQHFFRWEMDAWVWALSATVLFASIFYFRFWCRYLCPAGAILALFNKVCLLRKWSSRPIPARCDLGVSFPRDVDCIRCHRCLFPDRAGNGET